METILMMVVLCTANIFCLLVGIRAGQKASKGEEVTLPTINPMEAYRAHQERKEAQKEQNKVDTILRNVDRYDGTSAGQVDVPRG